MRCLQVINSLSAGGAEVFVTQLSIALRKYCDVEVFTFYGTLDEKGNQLKKQLEFNNIKVTSPKYTKSGLVKRVLCSYQINRMIHNHKPDIVHVHLDQCELYTFLGSVRNIKYVRTIHNIKRGTNVPRALWKTIDDFYDFSIHCSKLSAEKYCYSGDLAKYTSINNGIAFYDITQQPTIRSQYGISEDEIVFINIGSFSKRLGILQKGQDLLLSALAELKELKIKVFFIGDGSERESIMNISKQLGISDKLIFVGVVPNPQEFMCSADATVMPSRFEGLPIAAIECATLGLPLIASDLPAFQEFNLDSTILFQSEDVESLKQAMLLAYNNMVDLKYKASINSALYRNRYDINTVAMRYSDIYKQALNR